MALTGRPPRGETHDAERNTMTGEMEAARTREKRRRDDEDDEAAD